MSRRRFRTQLQAMYASVFSKPRFRGLNDVILSSALRARGYNNYENVRVSGERFFVEQVLAPAKPTLCIDIGANLGEYSRLILENTSADVIAFEPHPASADLLKEVAGVFAERLLVEEVGVSNRAGELDLFFSSDALSHASFSPEVKRIPYVANESAVKVEVTTLDKYCDEKGLSNIDLVKIDTEGFEAEVFAGASRVFRDVRPRFIQIEFNWHQLFRNSTLNWFADQLPGYDVFHLLPGGWAKRNPEDPLSNVFLFSNFVFVRRD